MILHAQDRHNPAQPLRDGEMDLAERFSAEVSLQVDLLCRWPHKQLCCMSTGNGCKAELCETGKPFSIILSKLTH